MFQNRRPRTSVAAGPAEYFDPVQNNIPFSHGVFDNQPNPHCHTTSKHCQDGHWSDQVIGPMDPTLAAGFLQDPATSDIHAFNYIICDRNTRSAFALRETNLTEKSNGSTIMQRKHLVRFSTDCPPQLITRMRLLPSRPMVPAWWCLILAEQNGVRPRFTALSTIVRMLTPTYIG